MIAVAAIPERSLLNLAKPFREVLKGAVRNRTSRLSLKRAGEDVLVKGDSHTSLAFSQSCWSDLVTYVGIWRWLAHEKFPKGTIVEIRTGEISIALSRDADSSLELGDQFMQIEQLVAQVCRAMEALAK